MSSVTAGFSPIICCGLMYTGVPLLPTRAETRETESLTLAAMPKSAILRSPCASTMRFAGLRSRCTTCAFRWACSRAATSCSTHGSSSRGWKQWSRSFSFRFASVSPATCSIEIAAVRPSCTKS